MAWGTVASLPWYAAFAFPWALTLAFVGGSQWPRRAIGTTLASLLIVLYVSAEFDGAFLRMLPFYAGTTGCPALERMASLRPELLGTKTFWIAAAATVALLGTVAWLLLWSRVDDSADGTIRG